MTLLDFLKRGCDKGKGITFIKGASEEVYLSYHDLYKKSLDVLYHLQLHGIKSGDELVFQIDDNEAFLILFWGCLQGGIVPVPLTYGNEEHRRKLFNVWGKLKNPHLVIDSAGVERITRPDEVFEDVIGDISKKIILTEALWKPAVPGVPAQVSGADFAYIQFSSGSTGAPKGVILTHKNLVTNAKAIADRSQITDIDSLLSWMPLTHDMGLICFHLTGIIAQVNQFILPTSLFVRHPLLWFEKASTHKATLLYSPNFGFHYFLSALSQSSDRHWDLSNIKLIYNGAEPIHVELCRRFLQVMSRYGLRPSVMFTGYGLAEASVAVTLPAAGSALVERRLQRKYLSPGDKVMHATEASDAIFVELGYPVDNCYVRICDASDRLLPEEYLGYIQISGDNVTSGYYNDEDGTRSLFTEDGWIRTGDLGFLSGGKLTVTGREKNTIIVNGQNYYPSDIERVLTASAGIELGKVVACGVREPDSVTDDLIIFVLHKKNLKAFVTLAHKIKECVRRETGLTVKHVIAVPRIPKTTSGKVQGFRLVDNFRAGEYIDQLEEIGAMAVKPEERLNTVVDQFIEIYSGLFGATDLTPETRLSDLGLQSLQVMQFMSRLSEHFGVETSVVNFFQQSTVEAFARSLQHQARRKRTFFPGEHQAYYSASDIQRRFWILGQKEFNSALHITVWLPLEGHLNIEAFEKAFIGAVERNEMLRASFFVLNGDLKYKIRDLGELHLTLPIVDISEELNQDQVFERLTKSNHYQPFDLSLEAAVRCKLVRLRDTSFKFILTINHLVSDGWSTSKLLTEFAGCYNDFRSGRIPLTKPGAFLYSDYVKWYKALQSSEEGLRHREFWKRELQDLSRLRLPFVKLQPSYSSYRPRVSEVLLSADLTAALRSFSRHHAVTPFVTLVTILNAVICKSTGQTDIVVGTDMAGRDNIGFEDVCGNFLNTVVLRSRLTADDSFLVSLQKNRARILSLYEHQFYSFDSILTDLGLSLAEPSPIFDILVLFQAFPHRSRFDAVETGEPVYVESASFVNLQVEFSDQGDQIKLKVIYNENVFDREGISKLTRYFDRLASQALDKPEQQLADFVIVAPDELAQLTAGSDLGISHRGSTLAQALKESIASHDAIALVAADQQLTYGELNALSDKVAALLRYKYAIRPNDRVAMKASRSAEMIVNLLGIFKSGACYVPIDPDYPSARIEFILRDSAASLVFTDCPGPIEEGGIISLTFSDIRKQAVDFNADWTDTLNVPSDVAYILYTSGSTGTPKGVIIEHRSLVDYIFTFTEYYNLGKDDVFLLQSSIAFDTSLEEIFPILLACGKLIIAKEGGRDAEALLQLSSQERATHLSTTPLVIRELNGRAADCKYLQTIISGGDVLPPSFIDRLIEKRISVYNTYGPTESTVCVSYHRVTALSDVVPIGKVIANRQVFILDDNGELLPPGITGEVYIAGDGLARGYLNQPELTAERFSYASRLQQITYRSGDLARWTEDGSLVFLGRKDSQVKIRGYRVELSEIERVILKHFPVEQVVVVCKGRGDAERMLVAYISANKPDPELQSRLADYLPFYMIPAQVVFLEIMPRNANGKVDIASLPDPDSFLLKDSHQAGISGTSGAIADSLAEIWKEIVGGSVALDSDFFAVGGNSIKATQVIARIRKRLTVQLNIKDFFQWPRLGDQVSRIMQLQRMQHAGIQPVECQEYYELTNTQLRLWLLAQLETQEPVYHLCWAYSLHGIINADCLQEALRTLLLRYEILRTRFIVIDGLPKQQVRDIGDVHFKLKRDDVKNASDPNALHQSVVDFFRAGFHLADDLLLQAKLINVSPGHDVLAIKVHHLIVDGWSVNILVRELAQIYNALVENRTVSLPALRIQYKDYSCWSHSGAMSQDIHRSQVYWSGRFAEGAPVLSFPSDFPRPVVQSFRGRTMRFCLDNRVRDSLIRIGGERHASLFMLLMASVYTLIYKYSGDDDVVIGTPVAGRNNIEVEGQVGLFLNTLPVRVRIDGQSRFDDFLDTVKHAIIEAYDHQHYPFDRIVADTKQKPETSHSPLFDIFVGYQNIQEATTYLNTFNGLSLSEYTFERGVSLFDLCIDFFELGHQIEVQLEYNTDLFKEQTIQRIIGHFQNIVNAVIDDLTVRLDDIDYLTRTERSQILEEFSFSRRLPVANHTLRDLFEVQVDKCPHGIALYSDGKAFSYEYLNAAANQIAHYLHSRFEIRPGTLIGVTGERSEALILSLLGIVKAGAAFLFIDADNPSERIDHMIADSNIGILVDCGSGFHSSTTLPVTLISLPELQRKIRSFPTTDLDIPLSAEHLAYVIYTSASTGVAKGVEVEHGHLSAISRSWTEVYKLDTFHVNLLQVASFSFDVFCGDLCRAFANGGTMVICRAETRVDPSMLYRQLTDEKISIVEATPAVLLPLANYLVDNRLRLPFLKIMIIGSDKFLMADYRNMLSYFGDGTRVINSYGTTETTVDASFYEAAIDHLPATGNVPIGRPMPNVSLYILDANLSPVPIGVTGELYIGGSGVGRGYLNRQALTHEKFIANPFEQGSRMYSTGDLARWMSDGNVEFLGRNDDQIKIRGYRIELGEIENAMLLHPDVVQAVALCRNDNSGDPVLSAYYVSRTGEPVTALRNFLTRHLPGYMLPSYLLPLRSVPLTSNGKVDRKRLLLTPLELQNSAVPENQQHALESHLIRIWEEVLSVEPIGVNDNFFELGGHSLKAMQMLLRIHKDLGIKVPLQDVFQHGCIESLALVIRGMNRHEYAAIDAIEDQDHYNASHAQKRLWILDQFAGGQSAYSMPVAYEIEGDLDIDRLKHAFDTLISRHEILRTVMVLVDGVLRQRVCADTGFLLTYNDVRLSTSVSSQVQQLLDEELAIPFRLSEGPLLRGRLIRRADMSYLFLFTMHHIVSDGWSSDVLISELVKLYNGYCGNEQERLPALPCQYRDYTAWQLGRLSSGKLERERQYWLREFTTPAPVLSMDTDFKRPDVRSYEGLQVKDKLNSQTRAALLELSTRAGISLYMTLLTTVQALLHRYTGQEDIVIGVPVSGREHQSLIHQIGFYVNTLPLRMKILGEDTFASLLKRTRSTALSAYAHQDYPFDLLVDDLQIAADVSRSPLFDVMVAMEQTEVSGNTIHELAGVNVMEYVLTATTSKFDWVVNFRETPQGIDVVVDYNTCLFRKERIERFVAHFKAIIEAVVKNSHIKVNDLPYLTREEEMQLAQFNRRIPAIPLQANVVALFKEQARKTPYAVALVFDDVSITYKALDTLACGLASTLIKTFGVGNNDLVGLMSRRSEKQVIGIWGVLMSGAAYLPIDPTLPHQRRQYMVDESQVKVLVVDDDGHMADFKSVLSLDRIVENGTSGPDVFPDIHNDHLAYALYTSGTTGTPKAVLIEHGSVTNLSLWLSSFVQGDGKVNHTSMLTAPIYFDASVQQIFSPLVSGGRLVIATDEERTDPNLYIQKLQSEKVHVVDITPAYLSMTLRSLDHTRYKPDLKYTLVGGDVLKADVADHYLKLFPESVLVNVYGPTETTVDATYEMVTGARAERSIGKAVPNVQLYILDAYLHKVPVGVTGELYVGGAGVARGYLNRDGLTREKFIPNPFEEGARLYRTGDLARWMADGSVEFMGRNDQQVKIRGYRIEPGEIENVMLQHPDIAHAVVLCRNDAKGEPFLVGYYVTRSETDITGLRTFLSRQLPAYMVPSYLVSLPSIPLTGNGKTDRTMLLSMPLESAGNPLPEHARNELESHIVRIWEDVLGREHVGINENFFELGGHSLKAMQVMLRLHETLGVKLSLRELFVHPTIVQLSELVKRSGVSSYGAIEPIEDQEYYGVSHAQKRLWVLDQISPNQVAYNMSVGYQIKGPLNKEFFEQAFTSLLSRHEILRTVFVMVDGVLKQRVNEPGTFKLQYHDLRRSSYKAQVLEGIIREELSASFNLAEGPLLRGQLIHRSDHEYCFLFTIHHIISDAWSTGVLIDDIAAFYNSYCLNAPARLAPLPLQYRDYAAWQNTMLAAGTFNPQRSYWLEQFKDSLPALDLDTDYNRPEVKRYDGSQTGVVLRAALYAGLRKLSVASGASLYMTLLSSVQVLLYRYTGNEQIVTGVPVSGREHKALERQIGFYVNTLPVVTQIKGTDRFTELLERTKTNMLNGYVHQEYPFDLMVEELHLTPDLSRSPLFDVMVTLEQTSTVREQLLGVSMEEYPFDIQESKFDLMFNFKESEKGLALDLQYRSDLFKPATISLMLERWEIVIERILDDPFIQVERFNFGTFEKSEANRMAVNQSFDFEF